MPESQLRCWSDVIGKGRVRECQGGTGGCPQTKRLYGPSLLDARKPAPKEKIPISEKLTDNITSESIPISIKTTL